MDVRFSSAAQAYSQAARRTENVPAAGAEASSPSSGPAFSSLVKEAVSGAAAATQGAESASIQALVAPTDLTQVVMAVTNAEVTLQTVVAVRDRVIQAYQDIIKMPI